jgi:hypothetical protein
MVGILQKLMGVQRQFGSCRSDGHRPKLSVEQYDPELIFQVLDNLGDSRLCHPQDLPGAGHIAGFANHDEDLEGLQVDTSFGSVTGYKSIASLHVGEYLKLWAKTPPAYLLEMYHALVEMYPTLVSG